MSERSIDIQQAYNEWVHQYETHTNLTRDLNARVLRQQPFDLAGKRVLEIGCGTGLNTVWLAQHAQWVVGVDIADGMLRSARQRLGASNTSMLQADITQPWPIHQTFEVMVANLVLEHVNHLAHVFCEAHRVLCPGGVFYLSELHPYRQLQGSQARYRDLKTGTEVLVPAFVHTFSDYINTAIENGFILRQVAEYQHESDSDLRLLTLWLERVSSM